MEFTYPDAEREPQTRRALQTWLRRRGVGISWEESIDELKEMYRKERLKDIKKL